MLPVVNERICVVVGRTRHKMMQIELQEAAKRGAQMIELRLDFLAKAPDFRRLLAGKPCPLIATVRRPEDGGRWGGTEEERQLLLRQAIVGGFDWVDCSDANASVLSFVRRGKSTDDVIRQQIVSNPHAPVKYRVNGVVRNMDAWYEAFHVNPSEELFLAPENRARIW